MSIETIIGVAASVFTGASLIPQLMKVIQEKKAESVSLLMLLILFAGLGLWCYYGLLKEDWIIIISNGFSFVTNLLLAFFAIKFKNQHKPGTS